MLEGRLGDFTLPDVLKLLAYTSKSGRLTLRHGDVGAFVDLVEGQVVSASADDRRMTALRRLVSSGAVDPRVVTDLLDRGGSSRADTVLVATLVERGDLHATTAAEVLRGACVDAVGELMAWTDGTFRFEPDASAPRAPEGAALRVEALLSELDTRGGDDAELPELLTDDDAMIGLSAPGRSGQVVVSAEAWALLSQLRGRRRLRELVDASGLGARQVRRLLAPLVADGVVEVAPAGAVDDTTGAVDRVLERIAHVEGADAAGAFAWPSGGPSTSRASGALTPADGDPGVASGRATPTDPAAVPGFARRVGDHDTDLAPAGAGQRFVPPPLAGTTDDGSRSPQTPRPSEPSGQVGSSLRAALEDLEALNGFNDVRPTGTMAGADRPDTTSSVSDDPGATDRRSQRAADVPRPLGHDLARPGTGTGAAAGDAAAQRPVDAARRLQLDPTIDQELLDKLIRHVEAL